MNALRTVGFAAWYRGAKQGFGCKRDGQGKLICNQHIHAVAISDLDMSTESAFPGVFDAREQIVAWAQGNRQEGLAAAVEAPMTLEAPMTQPIQTWERYKRTR